MTPLQLAGLAAVVTLFLVGWRIVESRLEYRAAVGRGRRHLQATGKVSWVSTEAAPRSITLSDDSGTFRLGDEEVTVVWSDVTSWRRTGLSLMPFAYAEWMLQAPGVELTFSVRGFDPQQTRLMEDCLFALLPREHRG